MSTLLLGAGPLLLEEFELPPLLPPHAAAANVTAAAANNVNTGLRYLCMRDLSSSFDPMRRSCLWSEPHGVIPR
ncbi:MAG TPA: hypothetical protein VGI72_06915 [Gaiellales bacterium]